MNPEPSDVQAWINIIVCIYVVALRAARVIIDFIEVAWKH